MTYFESWSVGFDFWKVTHSPYTSVSWTMKRAAQQGLLWRANSRAEGKQLGGAWHWVHVHCRACFLACRNEAFQETTPASTFFLPNAMCFFSLYSVPSLWMEDVDLLGSCKTSVSYQKKARYFHISCKPWNADPVTPYIARWQCPQRIDVLRHCTGTHLVFIMPLEGNCS